MTDEEYKEGYAHVDKKGIRLNTNCIICGKPLPPRKKTYCSEVCAAIAYARKRKRSPDATCKNCGIPLHGQRITFCCDKCRTDYYRKQNRHPEFNKEDAPKKLKAKPMDEILKGVDETGLSYGEYVARYEK